jgi:preprotein translocase YajC subunit
LKGFFVDNNVVIIVLVLIFIGMMVFSSRNNKKKIQQQADFRDSLKKGTVVITSSGFIGKVVATSDSEVVLEYKGVESVWSKQAIRAQAPLSDETKKLFGQSKSTASPKSPASLVGKKNPVRKTSAKSKSAKSKVAKSKTSKK